MKDVSYNNALVSKHVKVCGKNIKTIKEEDKCVLPEVRKIFKLPVGNVYSSDAKT